MKWYIAKRLLQIIPVILGVTIIAFSLIHLAPGDPARTMLGQHATQQEINEIRAKYGLDKPLYEQYFIWLGNVLHGDLGRSILSHDLVTNEIGSRFPNTIELAIAAMIFAVLVGVVAGAAPPHQLHTLHRRGRPFGAWDGCWPRRRAPTWRFRRRPSSQCAG
jgi:peptide/nickel transport system permease protein